MLIGFRLDANEEIATGHMMRCAAIALECQKQGAECIFLLAENKCTDILKKRSLNYQIINGHWKQWDDDILLVQNVLEELKIDVLVVDSYQATGKFLSAINKFVPVLYMDDMCKEVYDVSLLVYYSQWQGDETIAQKYASKDICLLAGMQYAPLREEFTVEGQGRLEKEQIMITTGGTDPYHISYEVAELFLKENMLKAYSLLVILGQMNPDGEQLKKLAESEKRLCVVQNVDNMGELMRSSKVAVSAGGNTLYELCATQTPTVCFAFSEDQAEFAIEIGQRKVMLYAGDARENSDVVVKEIIEKIKAFATNEELREECKKKMRQITDGRGAERIAKAIIKYGEAGL